MKFKVMSEQDKGGLLGYKRALDAGLITDAVIWRSECKVYKITVSRRYISLYKESATLGWHSEFILDLESPSLGGFVLSGLLKALEPIKANSGPLEEMAREELHRVIRRYLIELCGPNEYAGRYLVTADRVRDYMARQKAEVSTAAEDGEQ